MIFFFFSVLYRVPTTLRDSACASFVAAILSISACAREYMFYVFMYCRVSKINNLYAYTRGSLRRGGGIVVPARRNATFVKRHVYRSPPPHESSDFYYFFFFHEGRLSVLLYNIRGKNPPVVFRNIRNPESLTNRKYIRGKSFLNRVLNNSYVLIDYQNAAYRSFLAG